MIIPDVRIGTSSWRFDDWKGAFYTAKAGDELAFYARHFPTVEIDSTWYFTPRKSVVESWCERVPVDFRFAAKVPRAITHDKNLIDCGSEIDEFLHTMGNLGEKRGPLLFQFPPHWGALEGEDALRRFLPNLPRHDNWQFAWEFRHASWFSERIANLLREYSMCWTLADFGKGISQPFVTTDWTYIRWLGDRYDETLAPYNSLKLDKSGEEAWWLDFINDAPVKEVWGYFNNHWAGFSPASVTEFSQKLGLPPRLIPEPPSEQGTLF